MPRDMAYVFGGAYVPLSCKIMEQVSSSTAAENWAHPLKPLRPFGVPSRVAVPRARADGGRAPPDSPPFAQVLERRGWQGLEEVLRLLNGTEFSVSGRGSAGGTGAGGWHVLQHCSLCRQRCGGQSCLRVPACGPRRLPGGLHLL